MTASESNRVCVIYSGNVAVSADPVEEREFVQDHADRQGTPPELEGVLEGFFAVSAYTDDQVGFVSPRVMIWSCFFDATTRGW